MMCKYVWLCVFVCKCVCHKNLDLINNSLLIDSRTGGISYIKQHRVTQAQTVRWGHEVRGQAAGVGGPRLLWKMTNCVRSDLSLSFLPNSDAKPFCAAWLRSLESRATPTVSLTHTHFHSLFLCVHYIIHMKVCVNSID